VQKKLRQKHQTQSHHSKNNSLNRFAEGPHHLPQTLGLTEAVEQLIQLGQRRLQPPIERELGHQRPEAVHEQLGAHAALLEGELEGRALAQARGNVAPHAARVVALDGVVEEGEQVVVGARPQRVDEELEGAHAHRVEVVRVAGVLFEQGWVVGDVARLLQLAQSSTRKREAKREYEFERL